MAAAAAAAAASLGRLGLLRAAWGTAAVRGPRVLCSSSSRRMQQQQARCVSSTAHNKTTSSLVGQALQHSPGGEHGHGEDGIKVYEKEEFGVKAVGASLSSLEHYRTGGQIRRQALSRVTDCSVRSDGRGLGGGLVSRELQLRNSEAIFVRTWEQNWEHHGFSDDSVADVWNMRLAFFSGLSVAIVLGAIFVHYLPEIPRLPFPFARAAPERGPSRSEARPLRRCRCTATAVVAGGGTAPRASVAAAIPRVWLRREAERLVRERESAGLPLLTPDYYDRDSIVLPSVEEEEQWVLAHKREQ
ncbi:unnamed protein product [Lampetra fluviatilis]